MAIQSGVGIESKFLLEYSLNAGPFGSASKDPKACSKKGLAFIPKFEIKRKNTFNSEKLMNKICEFLLNNGIQASLTVNENYVLCFVEGMDNVCHKLLPFLEKHHEFFF